MNKNFALIGAAGYIAPRHMKAIKETGNNLVAALDPNDSVGIIDSYFPEASFFTEPERFDRYLDKCQRSGNKIDYVSICSPNYLHDAHIRMALRNKINVICEKPVVLYPKNIKALQEIQNEMGKKINIILQLRLHPEIKKLKKIIETEKKRKPYMVYLNYLTPRGKWYNISWKGNDKKGGGVVTNIGVHLFDMLLYLFGSHEITHLHTKDKNTIGGESTFDKAIVRWNLSTDTKHLPTGMPTFRHLRIDTMNFDFSKGFTDLHTKSYQNVLEGDGFGIEEAIPSIELVYKLRMNDLGYTIK